MRVLTQDEIAYILKEYDQPTMSVNDLARSLGMQRNCMRDALHRQGIFPPRRAPFYADTIQAPAPPMLCGHDPEIRARLYKGQRYEDITTADRLPIRLGPATRTISLTGTAAALCAS